MRKICRKKIQEKQFAAAEADKAGVKDDKKVKDDKEEAAKLADVELDHFPRLKIYCRPRRTRIWKTSTCAAKLRFKTPSAATARKEPTWSSTSPSVWARISCPAWTTWKGLCGQGRRRGFQTAEEGDRNDPGRPGQSLEGQRH